jgi:hypothetical protein
LHLVSGGSIVHFTFFFFLLELGRNHVDFALDGIDAHGEILGDDTLFFDFLTILQDGSLNGLTEVLLELKVSLLLLHWGSLFFNFNRLLGSSGLLTDWISFIASFSSLLFFFGLYFLDFFCKFILFISKQLLELFWIIMHLSLE